MVLNKEMLSDLSATLPLGPLLVPPAPPLSVDLDSLRLFAPACIQIPILIRTLCEQVALLEGAPDKAILAKKICNVESIESIIGRIRDKMSDLLALTPFFTSQTRRYLTLATDLPGLHSHPIQFNEITGNCHCDVAASIGEHVVNDPKSPLTWGQPVPHIDDVLMRLAKLQIAHPSTLFIGIEQEISKAAQFRARAAGRNVIGSEASQTEFQVNGPLAGCRFAWEGKEVELSAFQWRLVEFLWKNRASPMDEVLDHVYGHEHDCKEGAFKALNARLTAVFAKETIPVSIYQKGGWIILKVKE
jgi:hypothetical protein